MATQRRAILAVYDKTGIVEFARGLHDLGWELVGTGGTARTIAEAGLPITQVADLTGSPEMLGGRVKTLHPKIHGGILYRRGHADDEAEVVKYEVPAIDLVAGNLYPFIETVTKGRPGLLEALEEIDRCSGAQFWPAAVDAMKRVIQHSAPARIG